MLGLAPAIPIIAPTKTYGFFGNIFRPRPKTIYAVTGFNFDYQHVELETPLLFDHAPALKDLLANWRPAALGVPGALKKYSMQWQEVNPDRPVERTTLIGYFEDESK